MPKRHHATPHPESPRILYHPNAEWGRYTFRYYMGDGRLPSQMQSPNRKTDRVAGIGRSRHQAAPHAASIPRLALFIQRRHQPKLKLLNTIKLASYALSMDAISSFAHAIASSTVRQMSALFAIVPRAVSYISSQPSPFSILGGHGCLRR